MGIRMQSHCPPRQARTRDVHVFEPDALRPIMGPSLERLMLASPQALVDMTRQYGSPLNVVVPDVLARNVDAFRAVLSRYDVRFEIFYGAKVNKSPALVRAAVGAGIGIDVSSIYEMRDALRAGIDPGSLCATGPAKTRVFHMALVANAALISVDSVEELQDLETIVREIEPELPARVLLRYRPDEAQASRFGMNAAELIASMKRLALRTDSFSFEGFHFHLGGYRYETRVSAMRQIVGFVDAARAVGLDPKVIDIGGGMPVRYVNSEEYEGFVHTRNASRYRNGKVPTSFYPYGGPIDACEWLDHFLGSPCIDGMSIARYLNTQGLTLAIEPGRSLADQTSLSIFRITRVKAMAHDEAVIFVEGSSFSACETWFASEFLVDPIVVSAHSGENEAHNATPVRAWIAGHSCLDEDVVTNRLIHFSKGPQAGDLLVYANTAGYQMDLLENEFHRHPMPRRIAVAFDAAGDMDISPDDRMENRHDFE